MEGHGARETVLEVLTAPRRNNYYYAKMLDVLHFQMEQTYGREMRWLGNRLALGSGVLCGLDVTVEDGQLCVSPGVAIDSLGREIVVPVRTCLDPETLHDPCDRPSPGPPESEVRMLTLGVCHRECLTDYAPVLVGDCQTKEPTEAGTVVTPVPMRGAPATISRARLSWPSVGLCRVGMSIAAIVRLKRSSGKFRPCRRG